jgi:hypothetical protein
MERKTNIFFAVALTSSSKNNSFFIVVDVIMFVRLNCCISDVARWKGCKKSSSTLKRLLVSIA